MNKFALGEKKKKFNFSRFSFIFIAVSIPVLHWLVTYVYVHFNSFFMAFQTQSVETGKIVWGFTNFRLFFDEFTNSTSLIREAFRNTTKTFLINQVMFIIGFLVSFFLYKKVLFHKFFRVAFFLPGLMAGTVLSSIVGNILGVDGPIARWIMNWDNLPYVPDLLHDSDYANSMIFLYLVVFGFAGNMIMWGGTFSRIPPDILEAGKLDGLNWWKEIIYVTIPLVWPTFSLLLILNICGFFGATGNVFLLTRGNYGTMTISCWMYLQVLDKSSDGNALNYMSAVGFMMTIVAVTVSLTIRRFMDKASFAQVQF